VNGIKADAATLVRFRVFLRRYLPPQ